MGLPSRSTNPPERVRLQAVMKHACLDLLEHGQVPWATFVPTEAAHAHGLPEPLEASVHPTRVGDVDHVDVCEGAIVFDPVHGGAKYNKGANAQVY